MVDASWDCGIIRQVRASQPATPGSPPDWRTQLGQIIVEIETDAGYRGIGVGGGGAASIHIVESVLRDLLVGQSATPVEAIHAAMREHTVFYGRKGIVVMAISGVDLALWDIRGKAAGRPVAELLASGQQWRRPVPTYVTVFGEEDAQRALSAGHRAVKLHVERFGDRPDPSAVARFVREMRGQLGEEALIMMDAFGRWDCETALAVADAIAPSGVAWLEEPLPPDDLTGYAFLAERSPIPIAGGEHEYLVEGFQSLIDGRFHAVLQPDVNWCGGLTTLIEIYRRGQAAGIRVCPHRGCEPFALPAIAALDADPLAESPRSWFRCLAGSPVMKGGLIEVAARPGFGIDWPG